MHRFGCIDWCCLLFLCSSLASHSHDICFSLFSLTHSCALSCAHCSLVIIVLCCFWLWTIVVFLCFPTRPCLSSAWSSLLHHRASMTHCSSNVAIGLFLLLHGSSTVVIFFLQQWMISVIVLANNLFPTAKLSVWCQFLGKSPKS